VDYHNKYLLGSLESNIITGRALAKPKTFVGGSWGARVMARGAAAPRWLRPWGRPICITVKPDNLQWDREHKDISNLTMYS